jgi:hypothetical protein
LNMNKPERSQEKIIPLQQWRGRLKYIIKVFAVKSMSLVAGFE